MENFKPVLVFLLKAIGLYAGWYLLYELWLHPQGTTDELVVNNTISVSKWILELFGYHVFVKQRIIGITGTSGVWIGDPCNGLNLFALFAGFIICYRGNIKKKLFYIPLGILSVHFLNIIRVTVLVLVVLYFPESLSFNHTYTFTIIVYIYIFILWMMWVNRFAR